MQVAQEWFGPRFEERVRDEPWNRCIVKFIRIDAAQVTSCEGCESIESPISFPETAATWLGRFGVNSSGFGDRAAGAAGLS